MTTSPGSASRAHRSPQVLRGRVAPAHRREDRVAARLQRHVQVRTERLGRGENAEEPGRQIERLDAREPDARDAGRGDRLDDVGQPRVAIVVAADVDAGEHDLARTRGHERSRLGRQLVKRDGARYPASVRHDAVRAEVVAAVLDLQHGAGPEAAAGATGCPGGAEPSVTSPAKTAGTRDLSASTTTRSSIAEKAAASSAARQPVTTTIGLGV